MTEEMCPEIFIDALTEETVHCLERLDHVGRCLGKSNDGMWVHWDFPGEGIPPIALSYRPWDPKSR